MTGPTPYPRRPMLGDRGPFDLVSEQTGELIGYPSLDEQWARRKGRQVAAAGAAACRAALPRHVPIGLRRSTP